MNLVLVGDRPEPEQPIASEVVAPLWIQTDRRRISLTRPIMNIQPTAAAAMRSAQPAGERRQTS